MSNMKVVDLNQRSDEWLQWRSKGVTASDIPIILGLSPYKTRWQLWAEKVGRINAPDISNNPNVKRGVRLEDEARQLAEGRYGEVLLPLLGNALDGMCCVRALMGLIQQCNHLSSRPPVNRCGMTSKRKVSSPVRTNCMRRKSMLNVRLLGRQPVA